VTIKQRGHNAARVTVFGHPPLRLQTRAGPVVGKVAFVPDVIPADVGGILEAFDLIWRSGRAETENCFSIAFIVGAF
jgi:hypothetical protein